MGKRYIIALSIRIIPIHSTDYLFFSSFGFASRDTELRRRVTRNAFSCSVYKLPLPIFFEARYVMGEEGYGRPSPDVIREPVQISRLVTEFGRDLVDETYRTQHINQRVININPVGALERKIITVLQKKKNSIASNKNKIQNIRSERKSVTLAREPIRKNRRLNDTRR